jgi:hypothetical protein
MKKLLALPTALVMGVAISACESPVAPDTALGEQTGQHNPPPSSVEMPPPDDGAMQPGTHQTPAEVNNMLWADEPVHPEAWDNQS